MSAMTEDQVKAVISKLHGWEFSQNSLKKVFQFKDFVAAMAFVTKVSLLAEKEWHHPDIDIRWNKVTLGLTTHEEGGVTGKDFKLATEFDSMA